MGLLVKLAVLAGGAAIAAACTVEAYTNIVPGPTAVMSPSVSFAAALPPRASL